MPAGLTENLKFGNLHITIVGVGPPVVALHGLGGTSYSWRHLVPRLSKSNTVYLVDLLGHGLSEPSSDGKYSIEHQADLVCRFVQNRDLNNLAIIGHSLGGGIALLCAVSLSKGRNRRLVSLVLLDSLGLPQRMPWFLRVLRTPVVGVLACILLPSKLLVRIVLKEASFDRDKINEGAVAEYASNLKSISRVRSLVLTAQQLVPIDFQRLVNQFVDIDVPTMIVFGREDKLVPPAVGVGLNALIRGSRLVLLDRCGHIPHEERAEEAVPLIAEFIDRRIAAGVR